ncbi:hypothetical protein GWG54_01270 [Natronococcus sp. JC468]|uniref:hypothetical protein n=1 Tax=Natronococcus sp. JC468 TaxID=1961921 RepID=UPI00143BE3C3|nr:hypothetical protein [Natronococcus sp. JC468]NKE34463.1 hypothetical protein [Natronococcus sp. JC468]
MLRNGIDRLREWLAVEDSDGRIEGSGDSIASPQRRRSSGAERERLAKIAEERRNEDP